jgi:polyphosphate glucokinase
VLVPNTELGHLELHGASAERYAAASVRKRRDLSWEAWAARLDEYLRHVELMVRPGLIILGGGVSRRPERFVPLLHTEAPVVPARLANAAGVVGAALAAAEAAGLVDVPGFELDDIAGAGAGGGAVGGGRG